LNKHHQFWVFERASFEDHFPGAPKNRGGRPGYDREHILVAAAVSVFVDGFSASVTLEAFANQVAVHLGDGGPGDTVLKGVLRPLWRQLLAAARERGH
jgi:hypothetical protein